MKYNEGNKKIQKSLLEQFQARKLLINIWKPKKVIIIQFLF